MSSFKIWANLGVEEERQIDYLPLLPAGVAEWKYCCKLVQIKKRSEKRKEQLVLEQNASRVMGMPLRLVNVRL